MVRIRLLLLVDALDNTRGDVRAGGGDEGGFSTVGV